MPALLPRGLPNPASAFSSTTQPKLLAKQPNTVFLLFASGACLSLPPALLLRCIVGTVGCYTTAPSEALLRSGCVGTGNLCARPEPGNPHRLAGSKPNRRTRTRGAFGIRRLRRRRRGPRPSAKTVTTCYGEDDDDLHGE